MSKQQEKTSKQEQVGNMTRTENGAWAFGTTESKVLDLFSSGLLRDTSDGGAQGMFKDAVGEDPELALKVLMNARDCRGGKGERRVVLCCLEWLRSKYPRTYEANLEAFVNVGTYRDLLDIVSRVYKKKTSQSSELEDDSKEGNHGAKKKTSKSSISLAVKWAPSERKKYDKTLKLAKTMAKMIFPNDKRPRMRYRKMLSRLRKRLNLVENKMSSKMWNMIDFASIPAKAHSNYKKAFQRHCENYDDYLRAVKRGEKEIKSTGLQPHDLIRPYLSRGRTDMTTEAQWQSLVKRIAAKGSLQDAIAVVDVSGSMSGTPMEVAIGLGLLVSQLVSPPYRGRLITFDSDPSWHKVPINQSLREQVESVRRMEWGYSTNISKVFKMILGVALEAHLPQEALPKVLFIFSDMQFDAASAQDDYKTVHERAKESFASHGYEIPQIVYWNLRDSECRALPAQANTPGVAMVSGFSPDLLNVFLDGGGIDQFSPYNIMLKAIKKYKVTLDPQEFSGDVEKTK
eukprot:jgi/Bigna1/52837/estExt_Genewise1Plus.C_120066